MRIEFFPLLGTALMLAAAGSPAAFAQTENTAANLKLSPAAQRILCERFPLNSQCAGKNPASSTISQNAPSPGSTTPSAPTGASDSMTQPGADTGTPQAPATDNSGDTQMPPVNSGSNTPAGTTPAGEMTQPGSSTPNSSPSTPAGNTETPKTPGSATPASPSSSTDSPSGAAAAVQPEELQKFAKTFGTLKNIQQDAKKQMLEIIQQEGLSQERFAAIYRAQKDPNTPVNPQVSSEEKQKFEQANTKINQVQQDSQSKMRQIITQEGLNPQRFEQILAAVQKDPALQQQVQQMMQQ